MLKTVLISLWACSVTAGTLFFVLCSSAEPPPKEIEKPEVELEPTFTEPMVVFMPVLSKSKMTGYLFANMSVLADTKILNEATIPLNLLIQDGYLTFLAGNKDFALPHISKFDYKKFKAGVKNQINQAAGKSLVKAVYMSDLNFVKAKEARKGGDRKSSQRRKPAPQEAKPATPKAEPKH